MIIIVSFTFIYVLKQANVYKSEAILVPTAEGQGNNLGGLGGLAAMAGVSVGGGSMTPDVAFSSLLNNYGFMKNFIEKNKTTTKEVKPPKSRSEREALSSANEGKQRSQEVSIEGASLKNGDTLRIYNNLSYADRLEAGHSTQNSGMYGTAERKVKRELAKRIKIK